MINNQIKKDIMLRVKTIYLLRQIAQPMFIKAYVVAVATIVSVIYVSVLDVFTNIKGAIFDLPSFNEFFVSAFSNAEVAVQISLIIAILAGLWFLFDLTKSFSRFSHQA